MIDSHVHITENGKWFDTNHNTSVDFLLSEMDRAGISKSVLLPIHGYTSNRFIYKVSKKYDKRFIGFGCMSSKSWKNDLMEIIDFGFKGIKFHPRIQHETILEWEKLGILSKLNNLGLTILICGWQQTNSVIANMKEIEPILIDSIAKKYSNINFIIAHMGGHKFLDAFFCARSNKNVFLDTSYFFSFFKNTSLSNDALVLLDKLDEKVIYGSDFPEVSIVDSLESFKLLASKYSTNLNKILNENIIKAIR